METIRWLFGYPDSYYNCSERSVAEWMETGERWSLFGTYLLISGTIYMCLYLPTIYAMIRLNLVKNSCYKIMFWLILGDMANLLANSLFAGYLFSIGAVFCMSPVFMYIEGAFNVFIWMVTACFYVLLGVNRLIVFLGNPRIDQLFHKIPNSVWILLALGYSTYGGILSPPMPYNSKAVCAYYVIFVQDLSTEFPMYVNKVHQFNNVFMSIILAVLYGLIAILVIFRRPERQKISKAEWNTLIQAVMITLPVFLGCLMYVYVQLTHASTIGWAIAAQLIWQTITGISSISYLVFNSNIRSFYFGNRKIASTYEESKARNPTNVTPES